MAYQSTPSAGPAPDFHHPADDTLTSHYKPLTNYTNIAAAIVSLGLIAGVAVWGYRLMIRDVTGIPIVQATEGVMRERPENPGGDLGLHQGLAVNAVAAEGNAEDPADRLILAPQPVRLTEEDQPLDAESVAFVQQAIAAQEEALSPVSETAEEQPRAGVIEAAVRTGSVEDLVDELTRGVKPIDHAPVTENPGAVDPEPEQVKEQVAIDAPGLKQSMRPRLRPGQLSGNVVRASYTPEQQNAAEMSPESLPTGTRLVQLGAYDSEDVARAEWNRFNARFDDLMIGKARVVQKAQSGGRTFYRLRAHGFADLSDARRFCSALKAEGADCIPVATK